MLKFEKKKNKVIVSYTSDHISPQWLEHKLKQNGYVWFKKIFKVNKDKLNITDEDEDNKTYVFEIATKVGDYFCLDKDVLGIENDIYLHSDMKFENKIFVAIRNISIFKKLDKLFRENIYIGGKKKGRILKEDFLKLIKEFPNSYELDQYASSRLSIILGEYIKTEKNYNDDYKQYMDRKVSITGESVIPALAEAEISKFDYLINKLEAMLADKKKYSESQWQDEILDILLLLFPKYVHVIDEAPVINNYKGSRKRVDFLLVDSGGNVDIIEIKKPEDQHIVTKRTYRDNHIPLRELSGTLMQVEKYLFHLNKSGKKGERLLEGEIKKKLSINVKINIVNPNGMIIMGLDNNLSPEQLADFEIIRRKHKNVIDIITYDDLLKRLKSAREAWKKKFHIR